jgi:hypothetical protein
MRTPLLLCFLLASVLGWGQEHPSLPSAVPQKAGTPVEKNEEQDKNEDKDKEEDKQPFPASASAVAPDAAVLTIKGLCSGHTPSRDESASAPACKTVITRAQFERLSNAVQPNMPATTKRQLASSYPRMLAMAHEAEQRGMEKQPHFEELMAFARLQILGQELVHKIQAEAAEVPTKDIEDYYRNNAAAFERANLERVIVPDIRQTAELEDKTNSPVQARSEEKDKDKEAMRHEAEVLRTHAATGEDFMKLQKEAYDSAGLTTPPPSPSIVQVRRASLPSAQQSVFDLKPGEISPVITDSGGFYIYKLVSKETEPLTEARSEIRKTLENQRMRSIMQKVQDSVTTDVNQAYFGAALSQPRVPREKTNEKGTFKGTATVPTPH